MPGMINIERERETVPASNQMLLFADKSLMQPIEMLLNFQGKHYCIVEIFISFAINHFANMNKHFSLSCRIYTLHEKYRDDLGIESRFRKSDSAIIASHRIASCDSNSPFLALFIGSVSGFPTFYQKLWIIGE